MSVTTAAALGPRNGSTSSAIFGSEMTFHISPTLNTEDRCNLVSLLFANGGRQVLLGAAKVIITDTNTFPGWETVKPDVIVVTPEWLNRSLKLNSIQPPSGFSPDPRMIFSGVVASSADLPQGDKEIMRQTIVAFGGQWREALTKDVTHVFALATKSERYEKAMALRAQTGMTILLPHWFDDMYNARRSIPTKVYEFPNPDLFSSKVGISSLALEARLRETGNGTFFRTLVASDKALDDPIDASVDVWDNKVVYLSKSLELHDGRRAAVESLLRTGGAKVLQISVSQDSDEMAAARSCDVFVTRYRDGPAFGYALKKGKIIGTLAWVLYVAHGGKLSSPLDRLLHFPIPPWPAPGFSEERLTITNYSGSVRDYLRKLIELLGGHYTPTMSAQNTQVVAASADGKKSDKARQWGIGVVNHTWLEDCFLQWKKVSPGASKYTHQAHGVDWSMNVGECGIGPYRFKSWEEEQTKRTPYDHQTAATTWAETIQTIEAALALGDVQSTPPADSYHPGQQSPGDSERFGGTNTSVRDAMEVDDEIALDDAPTPRAANAGDDHGSPLLQRSGDPSKAQSTLRGHSSQQGPPFMSSQTSPSRKMTSTPVASHTKHAMDVDSTMEPDAYDTLHPRKRTRTETDSSAAATKRTKLDATNANTLPRTSSSRHRNGTVESDGDPEPESQRRRPGRAAAENANKMLSEVLIPDMVKFQTSEKRGKRDPPKGRPGSAQRGGSSTRDTASEADTNQDHTEPPSQAITKPKRETASRRTNVFYMATLVTLTKEQTSALLMLGAKLTTRPELVTHLVTSRISKTLKFLACINFSPCIVTDEWVKASIEEKQLVDEAPYLLKDPNGEQQFNMTLEGALRRSKQHKGTLLKGYTFFVTPNGATDLGLTRDVVRAAGGEVKDGFPTARSKTSKTIVLSQESDKESWKKYPGLKIYSGELIYQALLCQKKLDEDAHVLREASG